MGRDATNFEQIAQGWTVGGQSKAGRADGVLIGEVTIAHTEPIPGSHLNAKGADEKIGKLGREGNAEGNGLVEIVTNLFHGLIYGDGVIAQHKFVGIAGFGRVVNEVRHDLGNILCMEKMEAGIGFQEANQVNPFDYVFDAGRKVRVGFIRSTPKFTWT